MKTLVKISNYYYVVDDKAEIKKGDYVYCPSDSQHEDLQNSVVLVENNIFVKNQKEYNYSKVIATTNPSLLLPQITNASDDMVGKEVEVSIKHINNSCPQQTCDDDLMCQICELAKKVAVIKPIPKETEPTNYDDGICNTVYRELKEKETSTNETLEEVAEKYADGESDNFKLTSVNFVKPILKKSFITGYKHCEKTMYSEDELIKILERFKETCKECEELEFHIPDVKEWFEPKYFNKRLNPNNLKK